MLQSVRGASVAALVLGVFGCSSLPDQAQMTGVDIVDIIRNVRCELKEAVSAYPESAPINRMFIAYNFEFTSIEENVASGGATLAIPLSPGIFRIGFDAAERGHREGGRTINISEAIGNVRKLNCSQPAPGGTLHYPVTGRVGISDVVRRYVALQSQDGLKIGTFTDQLHFWLQLDGAVKPSVSLVPVGKNTLDASLTIGGTRKDTHKILLTISKPSTNKPLDIFITNWPDGASLRSGDGAGGEKAATPSTRSSASGRGTAGGGDSRDNALRDLNYERSLKIQQDILDRLR